MVAVSDKLAGTTTLVLRYETRPPVTCGVCRAAHAELTGRSSAAVLFTGFSIQTPAELRSEAPSKHQLGSELKLHPNTSWAHN